MASISIFQGVRLDMRKLTTYIAPRVEGDLVQVNLVPVQDRPVNNQHQERKRRDSGVEQAVERSHEAWQPVKDHRTACPRIAEGVEGRDEEVEPVAPEGDPGEVAEGAADIAALAVRPLPAE